MRAADIIDGLQASFDRMIEAAESGEHAQESTTEVRFRRGNILVSRGWPQRYVAETGEPRGGEWLSAHALASPIVESGGICYLHGKRGTGKTRMAAEIARGGRFPFDQPASLKPGAGAPEPRRTAVYRTAMGFFTEVRSTYRRDSQISEKDVIDGLVEPGLLVLDEMQERGESAFEDRLLTHLIDRRYGAMRATILISNQTKEELYKATNASIADRIAENGRSIEFTWDSYRRAGR